MKTLIVATTYEKTVERAKVHDMWIQLHSKLNPDCDILVVDSCSPYKPFLKERFSMDMEWFHGKRYFYKFPDNIGHLEWPNESPEGRDGAGRAFCYGFFYAIENNYDYVVHIEGDSLFRLKVQDVTKKMKSKNILVTGVPYHHKNRYNLIETGLMFFSVDYLRNTNFIDRYDWSTQEHCVEVFITCLVGPDFVKMPWNASRGDIKPINMENVLTFDWITHVPLDVYEKFYHGNLPNLQCQS